MSRMLPDYQPCSSSCCCYLVAKSCPILLQPHKLYPAPLSMGFPRQEYWSGLPFPSPEDLPDPGIELAAPALQANSFLLNHEGSPEFTVPGPTHQGTMKSPNICSCTADCSKHLFSYLYVPGGEVLRGNCWFQGSLHGEC